MSRFILARTALFEKRQDGDLTLYTWSIDQWKENWLRFNIFEILSKRRRPDEPDAYEIMLEACYPEDRKELEKWYQNLLVSRILGG